MTEPKSTRKTNPFGKSTTKEQPYAIYKGDGPFGRTEVRVIKTYQHPDKEANNHYARWFVAVKTDWTYGSWDMGDSYVYEVILGLKLVEATEEWKKYYQ